MAQTKKLIGGAALAFALAGGGVAGALLGTPSTSGAQTSAAAAVAGPRAATSIRSHPVLEAAAAAIGISPADLKAAMQGGQTIAQVAQAHGVDPSAVIDAMVDKASAEVRARITKLVNGELQPGRKTKARAAIRGGVKVAAQAIGITPADLATALRSGQSIADVATAHGVPVQTVVDALVSAADARIDARVASGKLTAERAATLKAKVATRIAAAVERTPRQATTTTTVSAG